MKDAFDGTIGFQWDSGNSDKNLIAHNVEDWECEQVFFNKPLLILDDTTHSRTESRWAAFGATDSARHLVVVFTIRGRLIRVISARDMNKKERAFYEDEG